MGRARAHNAHPAHDTPAPGPADAEAAPAALAADSPDTSPAAVPAAADPASFLPNGYCMARGAQEQQVLVPSSGTGTMTSRKKLRKMETQVGAVECGLLGNETQRLLLVLVVLLK